MLDKQNANLESCGYTIPLFNDKMLIRIMVDQHWNSGEVTQNIKYHTGYWKLGMAIGQHYGGTEFIRPQDINLEEQYYNLNYLF